MTPQNRTPQKKISFDLITQGDDTKAYWIGRLCFLKRMAVCICILPRHSSGRDHCAATTPFLRVRFGGCRPNQGRMGIPARIHRGDRVMLRKIFHLERIVNLTLISLLLNSPCLRACHAGNEIDLLVAIDNPTAPRPRRLYPRLKAVQDHIGSDKCSTDFVQKLASCGWRTPKA